MSRPRSLRARILAAVLLAVLVSGCWNRREVNEVALVSAAALDRTETGQIRVTVQIVKPVSPGGEARTDTGGATSVFILEAEGGTLIQALRRLAHMVPRPLGWEHNNVLIFGEEMARQGVADTLDFFMRFYQSRLDQWVLVAKGDAAPVLQGRFILEPNTGLALRKVYKNAWLATGEVAPVRLHEFLVALFNQPSAPLAGTVEPAPTGEGDAGEGTRYRIGGAAVFVHDKLAGRLDDRQLRGIQWLQGKVRHAIVRLPCLKTVGDGISIEVLQSRAKMVAEWHEGPLPVVRVPIQVTARLGGQMCRDDLSSPEALDALAVRTSRLIATEAQDALRILQDRYQADPAGVGRAIERGFPARWPSLYARWPEVYPDIQVRPEVTVRILQTGTTVGKPLPRGPE